MHLLPSILSLSSLLTLATAHFEVAYPATRDADHDKQATFPCGGADTPSTKRTEVSVDEPLLSIAMKMGHDRSALQFLLGLGNDPGSNFNVTLTPTFSQMGLGSFCIPEVSLDEDVLGVPIEDGMNATVQIVTNGDPSGGLYHCADITFSSDVEFEKPSKCSNDSSVEASPFPENAAGQNANESTPDGKSQGGGDASESESDSNSEEPDSLAVPLQTAGWSVMAVAFAGGLALL